MLSTNSKQALRIISWLILDKSAMSTNGDPHIRLIVHWTGILQRHQRMQEVSKVTKARSGLVYLTHFLHPLVTGETWPDHYSGKYVCTVREAACLQGFPPDYEFRGDLPATKKQVANAVPPPVAKAILEEVKRSLMRTDASRRS